MKGLLFDVSIDAASLGPTFTKKSSKALAILVLSWLSLPLTLIVFILFVFLFDLLKRLGIFFHVFSCHFCISQRYVHNMKP